LGLIIIINSYTKILTLLFVNSIAIINFGQSIIEQNKNKVHLLYNLLHTTFKEYKKAAKFSLWKFGSFGFFK